MARSITQRRQAVQARSTATVAVILEAAAQVLEDVGLDGVNTNVIAARAGVSIGTLYQYFPNKAAIFAALIAREREPLARDIAAACAHGRTVSLPSAISGVVEAAVRHQLARDRLARALDQIEPALALDAQTAALQQGIGQSLAAMLDTHGIGNCAQAASDLIALAKGMIDGAGMRGETDRASLERRVQAAAIGYLSAMS